MYFHFLHLVAKENINSIYVLNIIFYNVMWFYIQKFWYGHHIEKKHFVKWAQNFEKHVKMGGYEGLKCFIV